MKHPFSLNAAVAVVSVMLSASGCIYDNAVFAHPAELTGKWTLLRTDGSWGDTLEYLADGRIIGSAEWPVAPAARWSVVRSRMAGEALCRTDGARSHCEVYRLEGDTLVLGRIPKTRFYRRVHAATQRACGNWSAGVSGNGIGDLRIGATVEQLRASCDVVRDTTLPLAAEGLPERRVAMRIAHDTIEATIADGRVWRVEVRSPRFRTSDSAGVGSSMAELRKQPIRFLGYGEGGPFVSLARHCGLSFRLAGVPRFARTVDEVPNTASVDLVLVLGCREKG